jgi:hypothetical protein
LPKSIERGDEQDAAQRSVFLDDPLADQEGGGAVARVQGQADQFSLNIIRLGVREFSTRQRSILILRAGVVFVLKRAREFLEYIADPVGVLFQILVEKELGGESARSTDVLYVGFPETRAEISATVSAFSAIDGRKDVFIISMNGPIEIFLAQL